MCSFNLQPGIMFAYKTEFLVGGGGMLCDLFKDFILKLLKNF